MKSIIPILLVVAFAISGPAAEAGIIRAAGRAMRHAAAGAIGITTAPVTFPLHFWSKQYLFHKWVGEGNYRAAHWMHDEKYNVFWVEDWWL